MGRPRNHAQRGKAMPRQSIDIVLMINGKEVPFLLADTKYLQRILDAIDWQRTGVLLRLLESEQ
jgi:hypothetical protein